RASVRWQRRRPPAAVTEELPQFAASGATPAWPALLPFRRANTQGREKVLPAPVAIVATPAESEAQTDRGHDDGRRTVDRRSVRLLAVAVGRPTVGRAAIRNGDAAGKAGTGEQHERQRPDE